MIPNSFPSPDSRPVARLTAGFRVLPLILLACLLASAQNLQATGVRPQLQTRPPAPLAHPASTPAGPKNVIIPAGTQVPMVVSYTINGKYAHAGDRVDLMTEAPVALDNRIVIPVGSYVQGTVTEVHHGGHFHRKSSMRLRFDRIILPNGYQINLLSSSLEGAPDMHNASVQGEGKIVTHSQTGHNAAEGAKQGAIMGASTGVIVGAASGSITNGLKAAGVGTVLGAGIGAGIGALSTVFSRGKDVTLGRGETLQMVIERPIAVPTAELNFIGYPTPRLPRPERSAAGRRSRGFGMGFPFP